MTTIYFDLLGYKNYNQADVIIYDECNNIIYNQKTYNGRITISLNKYNSTMFSNNANDKNSSLLPITNDSSNLAKMNASDLKKNDLLNKIAYQDSLIKYLKRENNFTKLTSKSLTSYDNLFSSKEKENNFSNRDSRNQITMTSGPEMNYIKYNKIIKDKNDQIENLKIKIDNLNHKINLNFDKYKGLFLFLDECLNEFFNDEEIQNIKNVNINMESIKKFDFNDFNKEEKYSIFVLLMNYLKPLLNFNYKTNVFGNSLFKTNINIIGKKYNSAKKNYLNNDYLKKACSSRNNRMLNKFFSDNINNNICFSIPNLREKFSPDNYKLLNDRFKTLV